MNSSFPRPITKTRYLIDEHFTLLDNEGFRIEAGRKCWKGIKLFQNGAQAINRDDLNELDPHRRTGELQTYQQIVIG